MERRHADAPEFEAPVVVDRSEAVVPTGHDGESVKVLVRVVVCTDGLPRAPTVVLSGTKEFDAAAVAAISKWKFAPGKRFGVPAAMSYTILVRFGPMTAPEEPEPEGPAGVTSGT